MNSYDRKMFISGLHDSYKFTFTAVKRTNLNWASIHTVVEGISYSDFIAKLNGSSRTWADGL